MSAKTKADEVSREMFLAELERAITSSGSVFNLSLKIKKHPRRIYMWRGGQGPAYPSMQRLYFELRKI